MLNKKNIQKIISESGKKIDAPPHLLPTCLSKCPLDGMYFDVDSCYRLFITERGKIIEEYTFHDIKEFLYRVFFKVTFEMAVLEELEERIGTSDPRKMIFMLQRDWMEKVDPNFLPQYDEQIARLLREYPYKK